jgi:hypothetical protein
MEEFSLGADESPSVDKAGTGAGDFDNNDFSLSMHEPADARGGKTAAHPPDRGFDSSHDDTRQTCQRPPSTRDDSKPTDEGSDLFEYLRRDFSEDEPVTGEQMSVDSTDCIDDGVPSSTVSHDSPVTRENEDMATEVSSDPASVNPLPREDAVIELPDDPSDSGGDFDSRYQSFLDGNLDGSSALELIDEALITCRWDEMRNILRFQPSNLGEETRRKRYLAEYYLAADRPLPALITLKSISFPGLDKSERKEIMLRVAACYEAMFNFEAAHGVYLRIIGEHPGTSGIEHKATTNYEKYVQKIAGAAPILEKVTSL